MEDKVMGRIGQTPWNKGKKMSNESRKKLSSSLKKLRRTQTNPNSLKNLLKGRVEWQSGHEPWNKGQKGIHLSPKSEFKKGRTPWNKGKKLSKEHCENLSKAHIGQVSHLKGKKRPEFSGDRHANWTGDKVSYEGIHGWIAWNFGKANKCENSECKYPRLNMRGKLMLAPKKFHWANKTGKYLRDRSDWMMLCPSCHSLHDRKYKIWKPEKWKKK